MLHKNFKHLSQVLLKKKTLEYSFYVFLWFQPRTNCWGQSSTLGPSFWQKTSGQCYIPSFKHLRQAVLEEKNFKFISFFEIMTPVAGPFWTPGPPSEQTFQRSNRQCCILNFSNCTKGSEKEEFEYSSMYFYGLKLGPPCRGPSWTL